MLINDVKPPFSAAQESLLRGIEERHSDVIQKVRRGNFEAVLKLFDHVSCPAGQAYFRV